MVTIVAVGGYFLCDVEVHVNALRLTAVLVAVLLCLGGARASKPESEELVRVNGQAVSQEDLERFMVLNPVTGLVAAAAEDDSSALDVMRKVTMKPGVQHSGLWPRRNCVSWRSARGAS